MNIQKQVEEVVEEQHVVKGVSMYPEQWAVVDEVNKRLDLRSMSHALRFIVNEYRRLTDSEENN